MVSQSTRRQRRLINFHRAISGEDQPEGPAMSMFGKLVEDKIRTAINAGEFDNLRGMGKPLLFDDDESQEDWAGLHLLRQQGFLPEWLELRKQIHEGRPAVLRAMDEWSAVTIRYGETHALTVRAGEHYVKRAREINAKIDLHNLRCPSIHLELVRFREDARPRLENSERHPGIGAEMPVHAGPD
jgi:hypothetical protein